MNPFTSLLMMSLLAPSNLLPPDPSIIAHQQQAISHIKATVHLEPDDSPYAGQSSLTWFHLTNARDETVTLSNCHCSLVVYDSQNQPIAYPQLSESEIAGHEKPITTTITFPSAGFYEMVFTGRSKTDQFEPFELRVPVIVRSSPNQSDSEISDCNRHLFRFDRYLALTYTTCSNSMSKMRVELGGIMPATPLEP